MSEGRQVNTTAIISFVIQTCVDSLKIASVWCARLAAGARRFCQTRDPFPLSHDSQLSCFFFLHSLLISLVFFSLFAPNTISQEKKDRKNAGKERTPTIKPKEKRRKQDIWIDGDEDYA